MSPSSQGEGQSSPSALLDTKLFIHSFDQAEPFLPVVLMKLFQTPLHLGPGTMEEGRELKHLELDEFVFQSWVQHRWYIPQPLRMWVYCVMAEDNKRLFWQLEVMYINVEAHKGCCKEQRFLIAWHILWRTVTTIIKDKEDLRKNKALRKGDGGSFERAIVLRAQIVRD